MRTGDVFLPPGPEPSVVLPQFNGGHEWGGSAFDPESGLLYINASNEAEWISMVPARLPDRMTLGEIGRRLFSTACTACHSLAPAAPDRDRAPAEAELTPTVPGTSRTCRIRAGRAKRAGSSGCAPRSGRSAGGS